MLGLRKKEKALPEYKVITTYGDRALRKQLNRHAELGYEVLTITQGVLGGMSYGRTTTFKLKA